MKSIKEMRSDVDIWWYGFKWNVNRKAKATVKWCEENKELVIAMVPFGIITVKGIENTIRSIDRKIDLKKKQKLQDLSVYDHSLGMYHTLKRPLRPSEKIELDRRRQNGESKIHILSSMGLLD